MFSYTDVHVVFLHIILSQMCSEDLGMPSSHPLSTLPSVLCTFKVVQLFQKMENNTVKAGC